MERSVLEMLSDRSSAPTLLGCRPSARKSLGRSQKRFILLTKSSFWSLHHDNNHSFKANSLLILSCPRRYEGRGSDTMIVIAGNVLRTVSIRLLKFLFSVSVCHSLVSFTPVCSTTDLTLSSSFRIADICAETLRTRAPGKQWVCTLPSANIVRMCQTMRLRKEISNTGGGGVVIRSLDRFFRCCTQGLWFPRGLCRETHGVEVVGVLAACWILRSRSFTRKTMYSTGHLI